jgi:hypothetical protein
VTAQNICCAQKIIIPTGTYAQVNKFLNSTTYIVINSEMSGFSIVMNDIAKDFWRITPHKIISVSEFDKLRSDDNNSFIFLSEIYFENDKTKTMFDFLVLALGGKYKTVNEMPTLCAIPLCYADDDSEDYCYKLGLMLEFMQNHINICKNDPNINSDKILTLYKNKITNLPKKTLYVVKEELEKPLRNETELKKHYLYDVKYATIEEIEKIIAKKDENAVIIHRISNYGKKELSYAITILIDVKNADIYYYDIDKMGKKDNLLLQSADLDNIIKRCKFSE